MDLTASTANPASGVLVVGNVTLNRDNFRVSVGGERVQLTYKELELFSLLVTNADCVMAIDVLTEALWGGRGEKYVRRLSVLIHRLRAKLARSHPFRLESVRGRGYGFIDTTSAI